MIVMMDGRSYVLETVRIEELAEWRRRLALEPVARVALGDADDWPPMVLYDYGPGGTTDATA